MSIYKDLILRQSSLTFITSYFDRKTFYDVLSPLTTSVCHNGLNYFADSLEDKNFTMISSYKNIRNPQSCKVFGFCKSISDYVGLLISWSLKKIPRDPNKILYLIDIDVTESFIYKFPLLV